MMSTSERAFNQVKSILGKLDRSIDQARERRTHPEPVANGHVSNGHIAPIAAPAPIPVAPVQTAPSVPTTPGRPPSPYGRAQPLPPRGMPGGGAQPRFGT